MTEKKKKLPAEIIEDLVSQGMPEDEAVLSLKKRTSQRKILGDRELMKPWELRGSPNAP